MGAFATVPAPGVQALRRIWMSITEKMEMTKVVKVACERLLRKPIYWVSGKEVYDTNRQNITKQNKTTLSWQRAAYKEAR